MITTEFTTQILQADNGFYLTQADPNTPLKDRIIASVIYLGKNDNPNNYLEISVEEGDRIRAEKEALMLQQNNQ